MNSKFDLRSADLRRNSVHPARVNLNSKKSRIDIIFLEDNRQNGIDGGAEDFAKKVAQVALMCYTHSPLWAQIGFVNLNPNARN